MAMTAAALDALLRGDLENARVASTPGGIERQEAEGQKTFVGSETLPTELRDVTREHLMGLGFRFGPPVDDIFTQCALPTGWKKVATEHSMWSDLVDETGAKRAAIFYKAAFYDRRAFLRWVA